MRITQNNIFYDSNRFTSKVLTVTGGIVRVQGRGRDLGGVHIDVGLGDLAAPDDNKVHRYLTLRLDREEAERLADELAESVKLLDRDYPPGK